ncbi:LuxS/MPP-like metallohydrolase [Polychaeton citri CBS 116435]|uniref:Cytochrome b-c1 complex subunit 2, mitochondrial n=1 Tax=Polychaeton citri CBS 116435 TaxID=1314669 RepID=A0A9P4Q1P3_9PEZI|nr:LuxS/MPP-like metallohydrolase [Polychaeton citri CBS 116435]
MLSRATLGRQAQRAARRSWQQQSRGLAAPASGSFQYETSEVNGVKTASRDQPGPLTTLAIVSQAGTRFQTLPGLTEGLEKYAFKNTERRSALRIQREAELLGAAPFSYHSRENLVVGAKFFKDDLPYFVELLAEVATLSKYQQHVFAEEIYPLVKLSQKKFLGNTAQMALNSAHGVAFHRGLGVPLYPSSSTALEKYTDAETVAEYAASAYAKSSFAVVGNGIESGVLSKWVSDYFADVPATPATKLTSPQSTYYGGEERISHGSGNSLVLAFPGSSTFTGNSYKPEIAVLATLLGGQSSIKWSPGFSLLAKASADAPSLSVKTKSYIYSDAGLLTVALNGSAGDIRSVAGGVVSAIKSVADGNLSKEDFAKAKALAKFKELEFGQNTTAGMELTGAGLVHGGKAYQIDEVAKAVDGVTEESIKKIAKEVLETKASVSAVGDLYALPYAEEIGLKV